MNNTAKNLIRLAGVVVGLGAAAWALRDKVLPAPEIHQEAPPRFREAATDTADGVDSDAGPDDRPPDDLTEIKGIGPVTAGKLQDAGVVSFDQLANADAAILADTVGTSEATMAKWIEAANDLD